MGAIEGDGDAALEKGDVGSEVTADGVSRDLARVGGEDGDAGAVGGRQESLEEGSALGGAVQEHEEWNTTTVGGVVRDEEKPVALLGEAERGASNRDRGRRVGDEDDVSVASLRRRPTARGRQQRGAEPQAQSRSHGGSMMTNGEHGAQITREEVRGG